MQASGVQLTSDATELAILEGSGEPLLKAAHPAFRQEFNPSRGAATQSPLQATIGEQSMANEISPKEISSGALSLLRIARTNDVHRAMAKNAALLSALEFGKDLFQICREAKLHPLFSLLQTETPPRTFLAIAAATLRCIRARMDQASGLPAVSDFDRHVLQGFAEALADLAWTERDAQDFDGPSPKTFVARIARHDLEEFWTIILQNYLANIFEDYFAALRVREEVSNLDPTVERDLRLIDARMLAEFAMRIAIEMGGVADPTIVAFSLDQAIDETLKRLGHK